MRKVLIMRVLIMSGHSIFNVATLSFQVEFRGLKKVYEIDFYRRIGVKFKIINFINMIIQT